MKIDYSDSYDEIVFLNLPNVCDIDQIDLLKNAMVEIKKINRPYCLFLCDDVESITGPFLGEILECRKFFVQKLDGDICFTNVSAKVASLLDSLRADRLFRYFSDINSAINYFYWEHKGYMDTVLISIPSILTVVPPTRKMVRRLVETKGYSRREVFQVETIIDELCNNAIEHSGVDSGSQVEIALAIGRTKVDINVSNRADGRNSDAVLNNMEQRMSSPSLTEFETRGRGLALVKMLSNDLEIECSEEGTCVHVTKMREGCKDADKN